MAQSNNRLEPKPSDIFVPRTEAAYQRLAAMLDTSTDVVSEDETHPLASLMDVIGTLIEKYEDDHVPEITDVG